MDHTFARAVVFLGCGGFIFGKLPVQAKAPEENGNGKTTGIGPFGDAHRKACRDQMFPATHYQNHALSTLTTWSPKARLGFVWRIASEP